MALTADDVQVLPSRAWLRRLAEDLNAAFNPVSETTRALLRAGLGDLALALAAGSPGSWAKRPDELVALLTGAGLVAAGSWHAEQAEAIVQLGDRLGLLATARDGVRLYPARPELLVLLGAQRVQATGDALGLMDHRHRGALFDVFAVAVALEEDPAVGADLVETLFQADGAWEEHLELGWEQAAAAVAWGAPVGDVLRQALVGKAFDWVNPVSPDWHRDTAAALLAEEARGGPFQTLVLDGADEMLAALVELLDQRGDEEVPEGTVPALDAVLGVILAGAGGDLDKLSARGEALAQRLGHRAARVPLAAARVLVPGDEADGALMALVRAAQRAGAPDALQGLRGVRTPVPTAAGMVQEALRQAREAPKDAAAATAAWGACAAVAAWPSCPELTAHLLGRVVLGPLDSELRVAAATALARHVDLQAPSAAHAELLDSLAGAFPTAAPLSQAGSVGAALALGHPDAKLAGAAMGLMLDGVPVSLLGAPLAEGLGVVPDYARAFEYVAGRLGEEPGLTEPLLDALEAVADVCHAAHGMGPYLNSVPPSPASRARLVNVALGLIQGAEDEHVRGRAAAAAGWIARGDAGLSLALRGLQAGASGDGRALLDLALGACGAPHVEVAKALVDDALGANEQLREAALMGLRILYDERLTSGPLAERVGGVEELAARDAGDGAQARELLMTLARLPLGTLVAPGERGHKGEPGAEA